MFPPELREQARAFIDECRRRQLTVATAESCSGGLLAGLLTEIPGASAVLQMGFITYSNASKRDLLGVDSQLIEQFGAVSAETAAAMAEGALRRAKTNLSIAVTGIAGPDGGTAVKPVGRVHIAAAAEGRVTLQHICDFQGDRTGIRLASVETALRLLQKQLG